MASTKDRWADEVEASYGTAFTPEQATNMISAAFLHYKVRKLARTWQPVKARNISTSVKVCSVSQHKRAAQRAASKHAQRDYHVKFSNAFAALDDVMLRR